MSIHFVGVLQRIAAERSSQTQLGSVQLNPRYSHRRNEVESGRSREEQEYH